MCWLLWTKEKTALDKSWITYWVLNVLVKVFSNPVYFSKRSVGVFSTEQREELVWSVAHCLSTQNKLLGCFTVKLFGGMQEGVGLPCGWSRCAQPCWELGCFVTAIFSQAFPLRCAFQESFYGHF